LPASTPAPRGTRTPSRGRYTARPPLAAPAFAPSSPAALPTEFLPTLPSPARPEGPGPARVEPYLGRARSPMDPMAVMASSYIASMYRHLSPVTPPFVCPRRFHRAATCAVECGFPSFGAEIRSRSNSSLALPWLRSIATLVPLQAPPRPAGSLRRPASRRTSLEARPDTPRPFCETDFARLCPYVFFGPYTLVDINCVITACPHPDSAPVLGIPPEDNSQIQGAASHAAPHKGRHRRGHSRRGLFTHRPHAQ